MDYAIRHVYDPDTSELFDARIVFSDRETGYAFRKTFYTNDQTLLCYACHERATISLTKRGGLYFKHFPNTPDCDLKDDGFTASERAQIEEHLANKESPRHKFLKHAIGEYLSKTEGVNDDSVFVDNRFLKNDKEKRRPDVLCSFEGKKIAFEIQLSKLPPKYIFKRHNFYKNEGIFLIWILDDFDPAGQNQTEKDIKHLNKHQNFFFFNDASATHSLVAQYKKGSINSENSPYFKWTHDSIGLNDLKFDSDEHQCYYISFEQEEKKTYREAFKRKHPDILNGLLEFYKTNEERLIARFNKRIESLRFDELALLEKVLGLDRNLDLLLKAANEGKSTFLVYFLQHSKFSIDLRQHEDTVNTLLQAVLSTPQLSLRWKIIQLIFQSEYALTHSDKVFLKTFDFHGVDSPLRIQLVIRIYAYNALQQRVLIESYDKMDGVIFTLLSAKFGRVVGHALPNFISLANNAVHSYKSTFGSIEQAFKYYQLWDHIKSEDKHETFQRKYEQYLAEGAHKPTMAERLVLQKLFPEVLNPLEKPADWIKREDLE